MVSGRNGNVVDLCFDHHKKPFSLVHNARDSDHLFIVDEALSHTDTHDYPILVKVN